jgi:glucokinase
VTNAEYFGGVDLGGTKVTVLIADQAGAIIARQEEPLRPQVGHFAPWRDGVAYYGIASQIEERLRKMMTAAKVQTLAAIGIGSAGPLKDGAVINSPNITVPNLPSGLPQEPLYLPLTEPLQSAFSTPARLENDCNTAVVGEVLYGVGKDRTDKNDLHLVYVTLSTGLGAGVWAGGRLLRGKDGNAAEIGHIVVHEGGLRCGCGNDGCAEAYCSGNGIVTNARARLARADLTQDLPIVCLAEAAADNAGKAIDKERRRELLDFITPPLVFQAAKMKDPIARAVIADVTHYGGIVLSAIANAYDPGVITIGGSIAIEHPYLIEPMHEEMLHHLNVAPPTVQITPLGKRAVEYGAIALAQRAREETL